MEYYARRRPTPSPSRHAAQEWTLASPTTFNTRHTEPIFVFPSAPFSVPTPSSISSPQSVDDPTSIGSRSRTISLITTSTDDLSWDEVRSPLDGSILNGDALGVEDWEWPASVEGGIGVEESMLEEEIVRMSRLDFVADHHRRISSRQRNHPLAIRAAQNAPPSRLAYLRSRTTSAESASIASFTPAPHPRIYIPLLSFFASLFSVDDSTLHLISHTPTHSSLFHGCSSLCDLEREPKDVAHGVEALLCPRGEHESLKDGLRVACDVSLVPSNPFPLSPLPLTDIFHAVAGIWSGGNKAWREVWY
ncbi:hypothetical protein OF83DRAFT_1169235 [Amylostereum chailletii]|nr:hypothetical protein OF83DRAFT_1169235 [Amylostereum chailletii]